MALLKTGAAFTGAQTGETLIDPTSGKRWALKRLIISVSANATVTVFDGTDAVANHIFKGYCLANDPVVLEFTEDQPLDMERRIASETGLPRGSAADSILKVTTSTGNSIFVAHYYEETP